MTDDEVVKVLAEFMFPSVDLDSIHARFDGLYMTINAPEGHVGRLWEKVPAFLTSYDAVAEVWDRLWESNLRAADEALRIMALGGGEEYVLWFFPGRTVLEHAHALAEAISRSKGE